MLGDWMSFPLMDPVEIDGRLDAVEELANNPGMLQEIRELLQEIPDMERILGRISTGGASPRDVGSLSAGLGQVPAVRAVLERAVSKLLQVVFQKMNPLKEVVERINATLAPDPPNRLGDGGVIAPGVDRELDELRELRRDSRQWMAELEAKERRETGSTP